MIPVSGANTGAVRPLTAPETILGVQRDQKPEEESRGRRLKPMMDEYVPEEPREPSGRYWMGKDEDGQPKICFDSPERAAETPEQPEAAPDAEKPDADVPEAAESERDEEPKGPKEEKWVCDTGKVDRELEKLKKKQQELEQRLNTETDETKIKDLERQLAQTEQELGEKDNDTYRRQHSTFTQLS